MKTEVTAAANDHSRACTRRDATAAALWTAAHYRIPVTVVVASNAEYGILKEFGKWEKTPGVPGLDLSGLNVMGTAASYGVDSYEAHNTDEVIKLVESGVADRERPTLINVPTIPVDA